MTSYVILVAAYILLIKPLSMHYIELKGFYILGGFEKIFLDNNFSKGGDAKDWMY